MWCSSFLYFLLYFAGYEFMNMDGEASNELTIPMDFPLLFFGLWFVHVCAHLAQRLDTVYIGKNGPSKVANAQPQLGSLGMVKQIKNQGSGSYTPD